MSKCMQGAGAKSFCAGGDVVTVVKNAKADKEANRPVNAQFFREEYHVHDDRRNIRNVSLIHVRVA